MKFENIGKKTKDKIFYWGVLVLPLLQFAIFYIAVNFNSFLLAVKEYDSLTGAYSFVGFSNFERLFNDFATRNIFATMFENSLIAFAVNVLVGITLGLIFSYYIYKKMPFGKFFKVILFMPSIISAIVMVSVFKQFTERVIPEITGGAGLLANPDTEFATLLFYMLWSGFGVSILMYVGAMNNINDSVIEAAQLDGVNAFTEFTRIVLPLVWPTVVVFLTTQLAQIFSNQMNLFSFYGHSAEPRVQTVGYYLYRNTYVAQISDYPYLAAFGLVLTFIVAPVTVFARWLLTKFGPSEA